MEFTNSSTLSSSSRGSSQLSAQRVRSLKNTGGYIPLTPGPSIWNTCTRPPSYLNPCVEVPLGMPLQHPVDLTPISSHSAAWNADTPVNISPPDAACSTTCQLFPGSRRNGPSARVPPWPALTAISTCPPGAISGATLMKKSRMSWRLRWICPFLPQCGNMKATQSNCSPPKGARCKDVPSIPCRMRTAGWSCGCFRSANEVEAPHCSCASTSVCKLVAVSEMEG
mmetsp:Transcript_9523/g.12931  ORF Transcript_9523/g.12931 Transcript_9523/m.12931 type:complete len:225 (-) Transcript_9523:337-1011(-)